MATMKDPQTVIGDAHVVIEQYSNQESNVKHAYFEKITHTLQHHDDSSASHTTNGGNPTVKSDTQPLNSTVTPNKSHKLIQLI